MEHRCIASIVLFFLYTGIHHFIALHFYCTAVLHFLIWWRFVVILMTKSINNILPTVFVHSVSHFGNFHNILHFFIITILRWSVICDPWCYCYNWGTTNHTLIRQWPWLINVVSVLFPSLSLSSHLPILWDTTILKSGQLVTWRWPLSVGMKGRVISLTLKPRND